MMENKLHCHHLNFEGIFYEGFKRVFIFSTKYVLKMLGTVFNIIEISLVSLNLPNKNSSTVCYKNYFEFGLKFVP